MRALKLILALCLAAGLCQLTALPAPAQAGLQVEPFPAEYTFGKVLTFRVHASSDAEISQVTLYYRAGPAGDTVSAAAAFAASGAVTGLVTLDLTETPLTPFAQIEYWWQVRDRAERQVDTPPQTFQYTDNRFKWQTLSQAPLTVHWYQGDRAFGQMALSSAVTGLTQARLAVGTPVAPAMHIYIYATLTEAQEAMAPAAHLWAEGRADPALNLAIVIAAPGVNADRSLGRAVPHEMMHLLLAQRLGEAYASAPNWLSEGLAVMNQAQTDPAYARILSDANRTQALFPLANLCGPFPADQTQAQLAYAESEAVVRYLRRHYPAANLARLLDAYAQGAGCEAGVVQGYGLSLSALEQAWRADLASATPETPLLPWVILVVIVLLSGAGLTLIALSGRKPRPA